MLPYIRRSVDFFEGLQTSPPFPSDLCCIKMEKIVEHWWKDRDEETEVRVEKRVPVPQYSLQILLKPGVRCERPTNLVFKIVWTKLERLCWRYSKWDFVTSNDIGLTIINIWD